MEQVKEKLLDFDGLTNEPRCTETFIGVDTIFADTERTAGFIQTLVDIYLTEAPS